MTTHLVPSHQGKPGNDPIFALSKAAAERKAAGHDVINATLGALFDDDGKLATLASVSRALREVPDEQIAAYAPIAGVPAFLAQIKREVCAGQQGLLSRAVAVATPGGTGAINLAVANLVEPGQTFLSTSYYWGPYATIAEEHGVKLATFNMFADNGALDAEALERSLSSLLERQGRALLLINDPCHNPTGYSMSEADWSAVADIVGRTSSRGAVSIVLDSAYAAFSPGAIERPVAALARVSGDVLVGFCWSASKSFLLYGQRVGGLVLVPPRAEQVAELEAALSYSCRGTWSNCNHAGMVAVARILGDDSLRRSVDEERARFSSLLSQRVAVFNEHARAKGLRYPRYDGGFFVTVMSADPQRHAAALRERDIFVVPVAGALRVALCSVPARAVPRLVDAMADVLST